MLLEQLTWFGLKVFEQHLPYIDVIEKVSLSHTGVKANAKFVYIFNTLILYSISL